MNNNSFQQLKLLLEGKTIAKIEDPKMPEAIAKFIMQDSSSFRLHATDLGYWIEETSTNGSYNSLDVLIRDYYNIENNQYPEIEIVDNKVVIISPSNNVYTIFTKYLSDIELNIVNNAIASNILKQAIAEMGDYWKIFFIKKYASELPDNCLFSSYHKAKTK